jgi:hypothetical protein
MPELILTPPTFTEGDTIEIVLHGKPVSVFWRDEETLVIDGDARPILLTDFGADAIGFAFVRRGEDLKRLRNRDPEKVSDALCMRFNQLRERAAAERAERIERIVAEVEKQKSTELGRPLSRAERDFVRKLARTHVVGRTD